MPNLIASTTAIQGTPQVDGNAWVTETHTYADATVETYVYLGPINPMYNAVAAERAAQINANLVIKNAVPSPVTAVQARRALAQSNLAGAVSDAIAGASADVQNLWFTAEYFDRNNQMLLALGQALGLTSDQLDGLFKLAATL